MTSYEISSTILQLFALTGISAALTVSIFNHLKLRRIMATIQDFESALSRIDAATTDIADDIRKLLDQIQNQGIPADVENTLVTRLNAIADQLEAIGGSVTNPVPPPGDGGAGTDGGTVNG